MVGTAVSQGVYFYLYSLLRDVAVARKHALAGTVAAAGQVSRTEELPASANLIVASLAGMGNVLVTNPIWYGSVSLSCSDALASAHMSSHPSLLGMVFFHAHQWHLKSARQSCGC